MLLASCSCITVRCVIVIFIEPRQSDCSLETVEETEHSPASDPISSLSYIRVRRFPPSMDIQKWLDEIVQPDPLPNSIEQPAGESCSQCRTSKPTLKRRNLQTQRDSDSSVLSIRSQQEERPKKRRRHGKGDRSTSDTDTASFQERCSSSTRTTATSQRYARRPRHKTRPERYESTSKAKKEVRAHPQSGRRGVVKNPRRKSKGKKIGKQGDETAQNFRANNVSGDRLTVRVIL